MLVPMLVLGFATVLAQSSGRWEVYGSTDCSGSPVSTTIISATTCTELPGSIYGLAFCTSDTDASGYVRQYGDNGCATLQVDYAGATCSAAASTRTLGTCPITSGDCFGALSSLDPPPAVPTLLAPVAQPLLVQPP